MMKLIIIFILTISMPIFAVPRFDSSCSGNSQIIPERCSICRSTYSDDMAYLRGLCLDCCYHDTAEDRYYLKAELEICQCKISSPIKEFLESYKPNKYPNFTIKYTNSKKTPRIHLFNKYGRKNIVNVKFWSSDEIDQFLHTTLDYDYSSEKNK